MRTSLFSLPLSSSSWLSKSYISLQIDFSETGLESFTFLYSVFDGYVIATRRCVVLSSLLMRRRKIFGYVCRDKSEETSKFHKTLSPQTY